MHTNSTHWRTPKGHPSERKKSGVANSLKRKSSKIEDTVTKKSDFEAVNYTFIDDNGWTSSFSIVSCDLCTSVKCLRVVVGQSYGFSRNVGLICLEFGHSF